MGPEIRHPSSNQSLTTLFLSMDGIRLTTEHSVQIKKIQIFFIIKNAKRWQGTLDTLYFPCFSSPDPC